MGTFSFQNICFFFHWHGWQSQNRRVLVLDHMFSMKGWWIGLAGWVFFFGTQGGEGDGWKNQPLNIQHLCCLHLVDVATQAKQTLIIKRPNGSPTSSRGKYLEHILALQFAGATSFAHKAAALLHAIKLETGDHISAYCNQVVGCLPDQGWEWGMTSFGAELRMI